MVLQETITITDTINFETAIETFIQIETMGRSPKTKTWYKDKLYRIADQLGGLDKPINSIMELDIFTWYETMEASPRSADTKHGYTRAIRKFFRFLHRRDLLAVDLTRDIRLPRLPKRARKGISDENVSKMLKASKNNPRDYALLNFLESTNARRGGVADLKISNLFLDRKDQLKRRAIIHEKGDVDRMVVMSRQTYHALVKWLKVRGNNCDHVFTTADGKPLTPSGISEILDRYKVRLKIKEPCSPHQWRHRWCRKRLEEGMPLAQVSQLAGHKTATVTIDFYGTFAIHELHEAFDRYYKPPKIF